MLQDTLQHYKRLLSQAYCSVAERGAIPMAVEGYQAGVDISKWQGNVDFATLKSRVQFCYIRAGYGNDYIDPRCDEYRRGCHSVGLEFGLYWFVVPKDWRKHAFNFYNVWRADPGALPPVFDLEVTGGLKKSKLAGWWESMYDSFCGLSNKELQDIMTYTSPGFLNKAIGLTNWLKLTKLWDAHWTNKPQPIIPNEWLQGDQPKTWTYWQYSAIGNGRYYGVQSRKIDLDRRR